MAIGGGSALAAPGSDGTRASGKPYPVKSPPGSEGSAPKPRGGGSRRRR